MALDSLARIQGLFFYTYCRQNKSTRQYSRLDLLEILSYNKFMNKKRMGRPPKNKAERKDVDLRVPVTAAQKARIVEAVSLDGLDMAEWARAILLRAAENRLAKA